jgi:hypothetical protein
MPLPGSKQKSPIAQGAQLPQCASVPLMTQAPAQQSSKGPHTVPHMPQLRGSFCVSTQLAPHCCRFAPQVTSQLPVEHTVPATQAMPQSPQLSPSTFSSTHTSAQLESPLGQPQLPLMHASDPGHAVPQPPQFAGSLATNTHSPLQ